MAEPAAIVREVAAAVGLAEGERGVRAVLNALSRLEPVSIRRLSRTVELPVPIVASICGELRKRHVVAEERPAQLTPIGRRLFAAGSLTLDQPVTCPACAGRGIAVPSDLRPIAVALKRTAWAAPPPVLELDQCHCTVETKMRRVLALHEADGLVGRRIVLLGDDDLTSVAIRRFVERFGSETTVTELAVVDLDPAILAFVHEQLRGAPFPVRCIECDLREPLPAGLRYAFDTVVTDPPYTVAAARLFLSRAAEALLGNGGDVSFSFGSRRPEAAFHVQQAIVEAGFAIRRLIRDFNEYIGAGVLGGTSNLYHLTATSSLRPLITGRFEGPLYTADLDDASHSRSSVWRGAGSALSSSSRNSPTVP